MHKTFKAYFTLLSCVNAATHHHQTGHKRTNFMWMDLVNICVKFLQANCLCRDVSMQTTYTNLPCTLSSPGIAVIGTESVMFGLPHLILFCSLLLFSASSKGSTAATLGSPSPSSRLSASSCRSSSASLSVVSAPSAAWRKIYHMI